MKTQYIRFGDIPENEISQVHGGDMGVIRDEVGVCVYDCIEKDGVYKIVMPSLDEGAFNDLRDFVFSNYDVTPRPIYLVKGTEVGVGCYGEPCIKNISIISELKQYNSEPPKKTIYDKSNIQLKYFKSE